MRWFEEERLDFIDILLMTRGGVLRSDLVERFGISMSQASQDVNRFIALFPDAMSYDKSARFYRAAPRYQSRRGHRRKIVDALTAMADAGSRLGWRSSGKSRIARKDNNPLL